MPNLVLLSVTKPPHAAKIEVCTAFRFQVNRVRGTGRRMNQHVLCSLLRLFETRCHSKMKKCQSNSLCRYAEHLVTITNTHLN